MSVAELQARTQQKLNKLTADKPTDAMCLFLAARPVGSKRKDLLAKDFQLFQRIVGRLGEGDYESLLFKLKQQSAELLIDYIHRYMQYIGECDKQGMTSGLMLNLYERVVKEYGPGIIIKANFRQDTMVGRINNY